MVEFRTCEKRVNKKWIPFKFKKLKKKDIFRLYEPDGELVCGKKAWRCLKKSVLCKPPGNSAMEAESILLKNVDNK